MRRHLLLLSFICCMIVPAGLHAESIMLYLITTGQAGKQVQLDMFHSSLWSFTVTTPFVLGGGDFVMKDGPNTNTNSMLSVLEASQVVELANTPFTQSYSPIQYFFGTAPTLLAGTTYHVKLTAPDAPDQQDVAYFIKNYDQAKLATRNGDGSFTVLQHPEDYIGPMTNQITTEMGGTDPIVTSDAPEPASWMLLAGGALLTGFRRFHRN